MPPGPDIADLDDEAEDFRADDEDAMWTLFYEYGRGQRTQFVLGSVASVLARGTELLPPLILAAAIDGLFFDRRPLGASLPLLPESVVPGTEEAQFVFVVGLFAGLYVVGAGLNWANNWAWNHFAQHLQHEVRVDTYEAVQRLDMSFFDDKQTGEVMSVLNNDVNRLEFFFTTDFSVLVRILVTVVGSAAFMFWLNWQLALVSFAVVPILAAASVGFIRLIHPKYQDVRQSVGALNSRLENNVGGIEVIKTHTAEPFETGRVEDASRDYLDANWDAITTRITFYPAMRVLTGAGFVATFVVGGYWVLFGTPPLLSGALTVGTLVAFLMYSRRFIQPMRRLGTLVNNYQYARAASERILGLMRDTRTVEESADGVELTGIEGEVDYEGVTFAYEGADDPTIRDASFGVEAGEMVGIVGSTGAGKSTLVKLLMRLYDPESGTIRIDGTDIQDATLESLRATVGHVAQDPFLFYGTVRENIAYGLTDVDDAAVRRAAERAGAIEFVEELPDGLDTMVGERGVKLSGGQRQRIALARTVLRDPEILILDEATSHVDNETEVVIKRNLSDLTADRTTFVIAHQLSTVRNADRILVLDDGEIAERGTHAELLERDGLYANLWRVQVGEIEDLPEEFVEAARSPDPVAQD